ncbi:MAG TPA: DMT family transporter [Pyrinomonadaceae bacterium]|jgi:drug/metabolite transporter (DMT)-like permease|nr:DMT family transporter [Pyrinomonadaceae bacterium]
MSDTTETSGRAGEEGAANAYLYMLSGSLAFATMGALSHAAGARTDWQLVAVARTLVAAVLSASLALSLGVRLVFLRPAVLWMRSLVGSLGVLCAFYSLTHQPVSTALTLSNTVPFWVTLLAWPVLGQRPARAVWVAVGAGLVGVVLIQRPDVSGDRLAGLAALGNALCTAVAMLVLNRLGGVDARAVVTHFSVVSTAATLLFLFFTGGAVDYGTLRGPGTLLLLAGVGATGTLGQLGMTKAFALGNPAKVAVVGLMQIVFALAFDLAVWRRPFDALTAVGIALVALPSAWLMLRNPLRKSAEIHLTQS